MKIGEAHRNVRSSSFFKFLLLFRILTLINGAGGICALILLAQGRSMRQSIADYKEDKQVRCASPIFMLIAYYLGFTNRKRKYSEEKMTPTLKSKQTSIATV
jgi:hypothetical protein